MSRGLTPTRGMLSVCDVVWWDGLVTSQRTCRRTLTTLRLECRSADGERLYRRLRSARGAVPSVSAARAEREAASLMIQQGQVEQPAPAGHRRGRTGRSRAHRGHQL